MWEDRDMYMYIYKLTSERTIISISCSSVQF